MRVLFPAALVVSAIVSVVPALVAPLLVHPQVWLVHAVLAAQTVALSVPKVVLAVVHIEVVPVLAAVHLAAHQAAVPTVAAQVVNDSLTAAQAVHPFHLPNTSAVVFHHHLQVFTLNQALHHPPLSTSVAATPRVQVVDFKALLVHP